MSADNKKYRRTAAERRLNNERSFKKYMENQFETRGNSFSAMVNKELAYKGWTQKLFADKCQLSLTTIKRVCSNNNGKGEPYIPDIEVIISIGIALDLCRDKAKELLFAGMPELRVWSKYLNGELELGDFALERSKVNLFADTNDTN